MRVSSILGVCSVLVALGAPSFANKTIRNADEPANLPPADFNGLQFVDNKGCVYVRSGYAGRITWIPRVDRKRRHLCNDEFTPTFASPVVASVDDKPETDNPLKALSERLKSKPKPVEEPVATVSVEEPNSGLALPAPQAVAPSETVEEQSTDGLVTDKPQNPLLALLGGKPRQKPAVTAEAEKSEVEVDVAEQEVVVETPAIVAETTEPAAVEKPKQKNIFERLKTTKKPAAETTVAIAEPVAETPKVVVKPVPVVETKPVVKAKPVVKKKPVKVAKVEPTAPAKPVSKLKSGNYVRIGNLSNASKATATSDWFKASGYKVAFDADGALMVGPFRSTGAAKAALYQARGAGFSKADVVSR